MDWEYKQRLGVERWAKFNITVTILVEPIRRVRLVSKIRVTFKSYENISFHVQREFEDEYWDELDDQEKEETVAIIAEEWLYDIVNWDWEVVDD